MSPTVYRSVLTWAALCAAAGLLAVSLRAADDAGAKTPEKSAAAKPPSEARTKENVDADAAGIASKSKNSKRTPAEEALEKPITLDFVSTPLKDVAEAIGSIAEINVLADMKAINEAGIGPCTVVNFSCERLPLRTALRVMLDQHDLSYVIASDNVLLITTATKERETMVVRVYDIHDLLTLGGAAPARSSAGGAASCGSLGSARPARGGLDLAGDSSGGLVDAITSCIAPTSWTEAGGNGSIALTNNALTVAQTEAVHRQIAAVLAELHGPAGAAGGSSTARVPQTNGADANAKIQAALGGRHDFDFVATPLKDFGDFLRKLGMPVIFDQKALTEANITLDTQITFQAKQIRVGDGLRMVLGDMDLSFWIDDGLLVVSTEAKYKEHIRPLVYPVGDLLRLDDESADESAEPDSSDLSDLITSTVAPTSWSQAGGSGACAPVGRALIISQTDEGHAACAKLLADLRATRHSQKPAPDPNEFIVQKYLLTVKPEALDDCMTLLRAAVQPKSWNAEGVLVVNLDGMLVIRQTRAVHNEIRSFLKSLDLIAPKNLAGGGVGLSANAGGAPAAGTVGAAPANQGGAAF